MEDAVKFFGCLALIVTVVGFINEVWFKHTHVDKLASWLMHICAGAIAGLAISLLVGQSHILMDDEYKEYKELKSQYLNSPEVFRNNNRTCWNINGAKHCGDFTYEDNKTLIEVKNGSTNITVK